jgi:hypothetical protein
MISQGDYVAIQDSDDEWLPPKLEKQVSVFASWANEVDIVYTDMWRVDENGKKKYWQAPRIMPGDSQVYRKALANGLRCIGTVTLLIRRECFDRSGLFDESLPMQIDTELLIRMAKHFSFCHVGEPLVNYFATSGSVSSTAEARIGAQRMIMEKYSGELRKDRRLMASHHYALGCILCDDGQMGLGSRHLLRASAAYPLNPKHISAALLSLLGRSVYQAVTDKYRHIKGL